jgi:hypothetical protein
MNKYLLYNVQYTAMYPISGVGYKDEGNNNSEYSNRGTNS